jgi:cell division protein ZapE
MIEAAGSLIDEYQRELGQRGYVADEAQRSAIARLAALRERILCDRTAGWWARLGKRFLPAPERQRSRRGVYLWGGVGRGKTWLMDLFFDSLPITQRRRSHFHHFMREVHAQLRALAGRREPLDLLARRLARHCRVLCLDELYVSDIADAMLLSGLFQSLLRQGVWMVVTSNVPPRALYADGLQRSRFLPAIELLESELEIVPVDGVIDYRLRALRRRPIYLDSGASDSALQMRQLFEALAGEHGESGATLMIAGRSLPALRRRGDVIWFDFATLCESARSSADYADIAVEFRTVLLSDVPVFSSPEQDNAARRFIALIDEFYDQGVKLVLSAAAAPEALYRAEALQFEFRRSASRLVEMQSEAYLARPHRG